MKSEHEPVEIRFPEGWWIAPGILLGLILLFGVGVASADQDHTCQGGHNCTVEGGEGGQNQDQTQGQAQGQAQGQLQGQGQAQGQIASQDASQAVAQDASNSVSTELTSNPSFTGSNYSSRETSVAIGNTAVIPAQVVDCFRPKNKMGRGWRFLFGAVEVSATVELDPACIAAQDRQNQHELDLLRAEIALIEAQSERERLIVERMALESAANK